MQSKDTPLGCECGSQSFFALQSIEMSRDQSPVGLNMGTEGLPRLLIHIDK